MIAIFAFLSFLSLPVDDCKQTNQSMPVLPFHGGTITPLEGGFSGNRNYQVVMSNGVAYVLRVFNPIVSKEEDQKEVEAAMCGANLGIAPHLHYISSDYSLMITSFVSGPTLSSDLIQDKENLGMLLETIRKLHELKEGFPQGDNLFENIRQRLQKVSPDTSPIAIDRITRALEKLDTIEKAFIDQPLVPCHNDLSPRNIIKTETGFMIIDWTDASMSYSCVDLGYFALTNDIKEEQYAELLQLYLGRAPSSEEVDLLKLGREFGCLRLFATNFLDRELPITDEGQRLKRQAEFEAMLEDPDFPTFDYFYNLYAKGLLSTNEEVISLCICMLREFLD